MKRSRKSQFRITPGPDPECKWTEAALAQKLGVIQQTLNSWISDIRERQRANRNIIIIRLSRLACPPSFWRGWTQEQIAETTRVTRGRVVRIVNNTNFGEINTLLSQGRDMDYIARHYHMDLVVTRPPRLRRCRWRAGLGFKIRRQKRPGTF